MTINKEEILPELLQKGMKWNKPKNKLMLNFEKETNYNAIWHGKITGYFIHWLFENKLKISNFSQKKIQFTEEHIRKLKENHPRGMLGKHHSNKTRKIMSDKKKGKNHPFYGKFGKEASNYKHNNVKYSQIHGRAYRVDPKPKDGICAYCGKVTDKNSKTKLEHSNKDHSYRLPINPDDWQWVHRSCHKKYDSNIIYIKIYNLYGRNFYNPVLREARWNLQFSCDILDGELLIDDQKIKYHHIDWDKSNDNPDNHIYISIKNHGLVHRKKTKRHYIKIIKQNLENLKNGKIPKTWDQENKILNLTK